MRLVSAVILLSLAALVPVSRADLLEQTRKLELLTLKIPESLNLSRMTEHTITARERLEKEIAEVARRGYSTDDEEFIQGLGLEGILQQGASHDGQRGACGETLEEGLEQHGEGLRMAVATTRRRSSARRRPGRSSTRKRWSTTSRTKAE